MNPLHFKILTSDDMLAFGNKLAKLSGSNAIIFLQGPLGSGKTTFVRGFLQRMGYTGAVKSPTYTLVESYELPTGKVLHWDLYRLSHIEELELIGLRDYLHQPAWWLIEWPDRFIKVLPDADLIIKFKMEGTARELILESHTPKGEKLIKAAEI
jgi:tRNA threonylcarbamoyladenosine biosynthesis protein TsaE